MIHSLIASIFFSGILLLLPILWALRGRQSCLTTFLLSSPNHTPPNLCQPASFMLISAKTFLSTSHSPSLPFVTPYNTHLSKTRIDCSTLGSLSSPSGGQVPQPQPYLIQYYCKSVYKIYCIITHSECLSTCLQPSCLMLLSWQLSWFWLSLPSSSSSSSFSSGKKSVLSSTCCSFHRTVTVFCCLSSVICGCYDNMIWL